VPGQHALHLFELLLLVYEVVLVLLALLELVDVLDVGCQRGGWLVEGALDILESLQDLPGLSLRQIEQVLLHALLLLLHPLAQTSSELSTLHQDQAPALLRLDEPGDGRVPLGQVVQHLLDALKV